MKYVSGQKLFLPVNNLLVREVRLIRYQGERCVVSYAAQGFEREGRICISENRLYPTEKAAGATIKQIDSAQQGTVEKYNWRRENRWDEPGDGWGRH